MKRRKGRIFNIIKAKASKKDYDNFIANTENLKLKRKLEDHQLKVFIILTTVLQQQFFQEVVKHQLY